MRLDPWPSPRIISVRRGPLTARNGTTSLRQFVEQSLGLLQVERVEAFLEPAMDWSEKLARLRPPAPIAPESRHAHRRTEFPRLRPLLPRDRKRPVEIGFRLCDVGLRRKQGDFSGNAIDLGFVPPLLRGLHRGHRLADATPGEIELTNLRLGSCQI